MIRRKISTFFIAVIIAVFLSALLFACSFFYTPLKIIGWSPGAEKAADPESVIISVLFNNTPAAVITEEAFSISSGGKEVSGRITWQDNILIFTPYMNLQENSEYTLKIDTSAEDLKRQLADGGFFSIIQDRKRRQQTGCCLGKPC